MEKQSGKYRERETQRDDERQIQINIYTISKNSKKINLTNVHYVFKSSKRLELPPTLTTSWQHLRHYKVAKI
jgi:hypothetical protein